MHAPLHFGAARPSRLRPPPETYFPPRNWVPVLYPRSGVFDIQPNGGRHVKNACRPGHWILLRYTPDVPPSRTPPGTWRLLLVATDAQYLARYTKEDGLSFAAHEVTSRFYINWPQGTVEVELRPTTQDNKQFYTQRATEFHPLTVRPAPDGGGPGPGPGPGPSSSDEDEPGPGPGPPSSDEDEDEPEEAAARPPRRQSERLAREEEAKERRQRRENPRKSGRLGTLAEKREEEKRREETQAAAKKATARRLRLARNQPPGDR
jgi:hypothetical protein